jgi:aspartate aminotransferase
VSDKPWHAILILLNSRLILFTMTVTQHSRSILEAASFHPEDETFGLTQKYLADEHPDKILLGRGAYEDEQGRPWVLPSVAMAHKIVNGSGHEYLPIAGLKSFRDLVTKLIFHDTHALVDDRV